MKRTSWVTIGVLVTVMAVMVYSSLRIGGVRCEVCIKFHGRAECRTVEGATEAEALNAATTNVCALLTSGVTNTLACERTPPQRAECLPQSRRHGLSRCFSASAIDALPPLLLLLLNELL